MRSSRVLPWALAAALVVGGCSPRLFVGLAPLVATAAIVGTAVVLAHHDAHYHHPECGHAARFHEGHWVYWYGGHWEYYDPETGRWYAYYE